MDDNKIINTAAEVLVLMVVGPMVIGTAYSLIRFPVVGVINLVNKIKFNKKIKDGLKNGSICEFDGKYYEAVIER